MKTQIEREFESFAKGREKKPPKALSEALFAQVKADLHPSAVRVFSKLMGIHVAAAVATLSVCPQFGFRIFGQGMGLMHTFMALGPYGCMVACGAFFTSLSLLIAALLLSPEEVRKIRQNRVLTLGTLVLLSMGFFIMTDADILLSLAIAWFSGALIGSILTLELGWFIRIRGSQQHA
jgi:hypothetical protein